MKNFYCIVSTKSTDFFFDKIFFVVQLNSTKVKIVLTCVQKFRLKIIPEKLRNATFDYRLKTQQLKSRCFKKAVSPKKSRLFDILF